MKDSKPKKAWYKRFWAWVGIIVVISVVSSSLASKDTPKLADKSSDSSSSSADKKKSEQTTFNAGDVIEFDNKKVTVSAPERNWDSGNQFIVPDTGNEFIKVEVNIENDSSSDATYGTYDWKLQDSKGVIKDVASATYTLDGALNSGELAQNGKVDGFLVFEVPAGDTGITLRYSPSFWTDKKVEIKL